MKKTYGPDVGTQDTWKMAAKVWILSDYGRGTLPVYFAHCLMTGKDFARAAKIYAELQVLAKTRSKDAEWHGCYLAYNAGKAYASAGDLDEAARWYRQAAAYNGSTRRAVAYYASESSRELEAIGK